MILLWRITVYFFAGMVITAVVNITPWQTFEVIFIIGVAETIEEVIKYGSST